MRTSVMVKDFHDQTAILLHSMMHHPMLSQSDLLTYTSNQFRSHQNALQTSQQCPREQLPYLQLVSQQRTDQQVLPHAHKSHPVKELQGPIVAEETTSEQLPDALQHSDVRRDPKNFFIMLQTSNDDGILEATDYDNDQSKRVESSSICEAQPDPGSTTFTKDFGDIHSLDTLSNDSSDLNRVEPDESIFQVPQQPRRTYSSSEDSYGAADIETLASETLEQGTITTYSAIEESTTSSSMDTSSISTTYDIYDNSDVEYEPTATTLPDTDDRANDLLSVSSADAGLAWQEEETLGPPPHIIQRTYSSSESEQSCELDQGIPTHNHDEACSIDDRHSTWSTEQDISAVFSNFSPSRSQRGYIQSDPKWLEEALEARQIEAAEGTEAFPKTCSQLSIQPNNFANDEAKFKKLHILKKIVRFFNQIFGRKPSRSPNGCRSKTRARKIPFSSLFSSKS